MRRILIKIATFFKGLVLVLRPHVYLGWLRAPFYFFSNTLALSRWIAKNNKQLVTNDFYVANRIHSRKFELFEKLIAHFNWDQEAFNYLEFGVFKGTSFNWWINRCSHAESRFCGFDTFEGLPENWGGYAKGEMNAELPNVDDPRSKLYKGLFQDTLPGFMKDSDTDWSKRTIIHIDSDLFTSALFVLTSLAPRLKKGDIIFFDEFNVPNHEFLAFKMFAESYYLKYHMIGAVNNYYQVAIMLD